MAYRLLGRDFRRDPVGCGGWRHPAGGGAADDRGECHGRLPDARSTAIAARSRPAKAACLACFYAHEDKLSSECVLALYEGMAQLERTIEAISYVASQCRTDIETLCADTVPGEGRIGRVPA